MIPDFEAWAATVWQIGATLGAEVSLADFRKDVILDFYNEAGQLAISYNIYRCWVSEYQALPDLDANANAVAIQHIKLENEGWERDVSANEPTEHSFTSTHGVIACRPSRADDVKRWRERPRQTYGEAAKRCAHWPASCCWRHGSKAHPSTSCAGL